MKKITVLVLTLSLVAIAIPLASAENWQTVKTLTDNSERSMYFTVDSNQWRIRWQYTPTDSGYNWSGDYAYLGLLATRQEGGVVGSWDKEGHLVTAGTEEMYGAGDYVIQTYPANLDTYEIVVEQVEVTPTPSVPEFSVIAVLVLALFVSVGAVLVKKRNA